MKALFVALAACAALARAAYGADLYDAWRAAQQHDSVYAAARAQWQAGQAKSRQGDALLRPQVAVSGVAGYVATDRNTTGAQFSAPGFGASNDAAFRTRIDGGTSTAWAVTAQQPIYSAERSASAQQLERQAQLADAELGAARQALVLRVAEAYFGVVLAEETLATLRAQKAAALRALEEAKEKFDAGATPVTERDEAQARHDEIATREIAARDDATLKRQLYADVTGTRGDGLARVSGDPSYSPEAFDAWSARALRGNPLIAMQELGKEIARDELAKFRALVSPSLDLVARIADERMGGPSGYGPAAHITQSTRIVGVQLTIPLYTGGMRGAKRDEAAALAQKAELDIQSLRQDVLRQAQAAWLAVSSGVERIAAQAQAVRSARSRLDATETGHEVGARTTLDVLNAQSDWFAAQRRLVETRHQFLLDRLRLAAVAGALDENEVRSVNAALGAK